MKVAFFSRRRKRYFDLLISPLYDRRGRLTGRLVVLRDITERKRAEEALQEYSERLEEMVEERTKELREAQEELVRQEKLAVLGQLAGRALRPQPIVQVQARDAAKVILVVGYQSQIVGARRRGNQQIQVFYEHSLSP